MRLIDADELKRYVDVYDVACGCNDNEHQQEILEAIDDQPPVELSKNKDLGTLVELVTCKDCVHRPIKKDVYIVPPGPENDDWKCPFLCDYYFYSRIPGDNFFCANGERKEE